MKFNPPASKNQSVECQIGGTKTPAFGKIPYAMIAAGRWSKLTNSQFRILTIICAHCDGMSWATEQLGCETIGREAGTSGKTVHRTLPKLVTAGVLVVDYRRGRQCHVLKVVTDPEIKVDTMDVQLNPANKVDISDSLSGHSEPLKWTNRQKKVDTLHVQLTALTAVTANNQELIACNPEPKRDSNSLIECLGRHGIRNANYLIAEWKRDALDVQPNDVDRVLESEGMDAGPGARVLMLRTELPAAIETRQAYEREKQFKAAAEVRYRKCKQLAAYEVFKEYSTEQIREALNGVTEGDRFRRDLADQFAAMVIPWRRAEWTACRLNSALYSTSHDVAEAAYAANGCDDGTPDGVSGWRITCVEPGEPGYVSYSAKAETNGRLIGVGN